MDNLVLKEFVVKTNILKGVKILPQEDKGLIKIFGWTSFNRRRLNLTNVFTEGFPNEKPFVVLNNQQDFGLLPHVDCNGVICFLDDEGIVLNESNPEGIIRESLEHTIKTLRASILGKNKNDFFQEFDAYFGYFNNTVFINSIFSPTSHLKKIQAVTINKETWIGESVYQLSKYLAKFTSDTSKPISIEYLFLPLKPNSIDKIDLPQKQTFWTLPKLRDIIFRNFVGTTHQLRKNLFKNKLIPIIISVPLQQGTECLFGLHFDSFDQSTHPLINTKSKCKVIPVKINRMDKEFLFSRGGSNNNLSSKKVLVVGCGSVGSVIAVELAKAGITKITLMDDDTLSENNFYRHILGQSSGVGCNKALGLKTEIEGKLPLTEIVALPEKFQDVVKSNKFNFSKFDLVINATGIPNTNFIINKFFIQKFPKIPIISTWVEPYGIGGHVLVANNQDKQGCYKCLFTVDPVIGLHNEYLFAAPNQSFRKSIAGCASRFTPFSSLDSSRTALETVRVVVDILSEKEKDNPLISWKGASHDFLSLGYILSKRYQLTSEELFDQRYKYKKHDCEGCGIQ